MTSPNIRPCTVEELYGFSTSEVAGNDLAPEQSFSTDSFINKHKAILICVTILAIAGSVCLYLHYERQKDK